MKSSTFIFALFSVVLFTPIGYAQESILAEPEVVIPDLNQYVSNYPQIAQRSPGSAVPVQESAPNQYGQPAATIGGNNSRFGGMMGGFSSGFAGEAYPVDEDMETIVFRLEYYDADNMANLLHSIYRVNVFPDNRTKSVIVNAPAKKLDTIRGLVSNLDVPASEVQQAKDNRNLLYRIYMVEPKQPEEIMHDFSLVLIFPINPLDTSFLLEDINTDTLRITSIRDEDRYRKHMKIDGKNVDVDMYKTDIRGKAKSKDDLEILINRLKEIRHEDLVVKNFQMDELENRNQSMRSIHNQLPSSVTDHLEKLIGNSLETVGYWFGTSSISGELTAPVGEWSVEMQSEHTQGDNLQLVVQLSGSQTAPVSWHSSSTNSNPMGTGYGGGRSGYNDYNVVNQGRNGTTFYARSSGHHTILHNTVQSKIGKPIIIGYNRVTGSGRQMGALVIIPELDEMSAAGVEN